MGRAMPKILLVEDDTTMLSLLKILLEMEGFQVVPVEEDTLGNAHEVIRREIPALVLVDVNLHQFNGFDLLRKIRGDSDLKDLRVLMSSGMDYTTKCAQEGADDFILKPYMPDDLIQKIRKTLNSVRN
jgi:DNA-binding response OmpR family regulator